MTGSRSLGRYRPILLSLGAALTASLLWWQNALDPSTQALSSTEGEPDLVSAHELRLIPGAAYERQQFFLDKRLPEGDRQLPMDPYQQAREQMRSMPHRSQSPRRSGWVLKSGVDSGWQALGPGNVGGRTRDLVFHPDDPNVLFAAAVSGGLWRSVNGGQSWQPIGDQLANLNIGTVIIDPTQPQVMYVGTGELYRRTDRPYSSMSGAGLFKSIDGGQTWLQLEQTISSDFLYVSDLVISHHDPRRLYAATNTGIWRSDNAGASFEQILFPGNDDGSALYEGCNELLLRDDQPTDWLLATCSSRSTDDRYWLPGLLPEACNGPCDARIYLSTTAESATDETDWQVTLTEPGMGRTRLAAHRANPAILYASSANTDGGADLSGDGIPDLPNGLHAIFRSDDGGQHWQATLRVGDGVLNSQLFSYADGAFNATCTQGQEGNWYYSAGWYNQAIAVNPINPDEVWVAGMEIYRSDDGGQNFGLVSHWDALWTGGPGSRGAYVHADQHALVFHPDYDGAGNRQLFATNDGGVYRTLDATRSTATGSTAPCQPLADSVGVTWDSLNHDYAVTQFYTGDVYSDGTRMLAGAQDNGTQMRINGNNDWVHVFGGDGSELAFSTHSPNSFYVSSQNANIWRTEDGGFNYIRANNGLSGGFIFITPFILDDQTPGRLFAGGDRLWRSLDSGSSWQSITSLLGSDYNDRISALALSPFDAGHLVFANRGRIHSTRSARAFASDIPRTVSSPRSGWISSLVFDPVDAETVYATFSTFGGQHVWKSTDGGEHFEPIDGTGEQRLPDVPVHDIAIDPNNTDLLVVATDLGLFSSADGGQHWQVEDSGFSQVITETLVVTERPGQSALLTAFTYGRGVWQVAFDRLAVAPEPAPTEGLSGLWYNADQAGHGLQVEAIDIQGVPSIYASWYTYLDNEPRWLTGVGALVDGRAVIDAVTTDGAEFVPGFSADQVQRIPWGQFTLDFATSETATLSWQSQIAPFDTGLLPLTRLTRIAAEEPDLAGFRICHSGTWFNRSQDGHGIMLEVLDNRQIIATWFVYQGGQQYWMLAQGQIESDQAQLSVVSGRDSSFPPQFDASEVAIFDWGEMSLSIENDLLQVNWDSPLPGFGSGVIEMERLTTLSDHPCL